MGIVTKKIRSKYREGQNGNLDKKSDFYPFLLSLSSLSLSSRATSRAPPPLPARPAAATARPDLRQGYRQLRLGLAVLPRPAADLGPPGTGRNLEFSVGFQSKLHLFRSPSFLHQIIRVRYGFSPIFRVLTDGWLGFDRFWL
ncbi:hypothetical protein L3X38_020068 [Prunus dulcis]|uniref:Uncharacterized protein n=1 Tax=Prunus dulcis TaxID=3755 RepID=A0AAD4ZCL3_PRUDU|nr:hypothetical protein L3X38_020068 [Prunus dulcis]